MVRVHKFLFVRNFLKYRQKLKIDGHRSVSVREKWATMSIDFTTSGKNWKEENYAWSVGRIKYNLGKRSSLLVLAEWFPDSTYLQSPVSK